MSARYRACAVSANVCMVPLNEWCIEIQFPQSSLVSHWTMMMSFHGNAFRITGPFRGETTGHRWIPLPQTACNAELWCFFHACLNKLFMKQSSCLWLETPWCPFDVNHYDDFIMGTMASQITSLAIVYSTFYSGADRRKHKNTASLAFVLGIHRWPVNTPHKGPVTR